MMKRIYAKVILGTLFCVLTMISSCADAARYDADAPEILYFGRWEEDEGVRRCGRGATYIRVGFTGGTLRAALEGGAIRWHVSIDGGTPRRFYTTGRETVLAENVPSGKHQVLLVRETEGQAGISTFRGFYLDDGESLLPGEGAKSRRLEFVGDSISAGSANMGRYTGKNFYEVENGDMAYGPQLARMLGADYSVVAKSGEGVCHNYAGGWPDDGVHTADSYQWTFYHKEKSPDNAKWDAERFPVDAVMILVGTNDFSDNQRKPGEEFEAGYERLLDVVREMNPEAEIICLEPLPASCGAMTRGRIENLVARRIESGDDRLHFIPMGKGNEALSGEDFTDNTHPTAKGAEKLALYLKDKVAAILDARGTEEEAA